MDETSLKLVGSSPTFIIYLSFSYSYLNVLSSVPWGYVNCSYSISGSEQTFIKGLRINVLEWVCPVVPLQLIGAYFELISLAVLFVVPRNGSGTMNSDSVSLLASSSTFWLPPILLYSKFQISNFFQALRHSKMFVQFQTSFESSLLNLRALKAV